MKPWTMCAVSVSEGRGKTDNALEGVWLNPASSPGGIFCLHDKPVLGIFLSDVAQGCSISIEKLEIPNKSETVMIETAANSRTFYEFEIRVLDLSRLTGWRQRRSFRVSIFGFRNCPLVIETLPNVSS